MGAKYHICGKYTPLVCLGLGLGARDVAAAAVALGVAAVGVRPTGSGSVAPPERGDAGVAQHPKGNYQSKSAFKKRLFM